MNKPDVNDIPEPDYKDGYLNEGLAYPPPIREPYIGDAGDEG